MVCIMYLCDFIIKEERFRTVGIILINMLIKIVEKDRLQATCITGGVNKY